MAYKGTRKPLSEIARELHVDAVVEGTVLRAGNRVRITAELVQVSTDRHLWAETYESELGNILTLQSHVASAIVNEIRINLTPEEQKRLATPRVVNAQAYEDYLKGRYYWNKRSEEGLLKAVITINSGSKGSTIRAGICGIGRLLRSTRHHDHRRNARHGSSSEGTSRCAKGAGY